MNLKDYIKPIRESRIAEGSMEQIVIDLFTKAGCTAPPNFLTVKSWLQRNSTFKSLTYFPDGTINHEGVFNWLRERPDNGLYRLQQIFKDQKNLDSDSPIDVETSNLDFFCWSLVDQFLDFLKFQRIGKPNISPSARDEATETSPPSNSPKRAGYQSEVKDCELKPRVAKIPGRTVRSSIFPHIERCCFYCVNWLYEEGSIVNQRCPKCPNPKQGSSSPVCKDYEPNRRLIDKMKSRGADISDLI